MNKKNPLDPDYTIADFLVSFNGWFAPLDDEEINWIKSKERIKLLIDYVIIPPITRDEVKPDQVIPLLEQFRLSNSATDMICRSPIDEFMLSRSDVMTYLLISLTSTDNSVVFSRLLKIISHFANKEPSKVINYCKSIIGFVDDMLKQTIRLDMGENGIYFMLLADNKGHLGVSEWLYGNQLITKLISNLKTNSGKNSILEIKIVTVIMTLIVFNDQYMKMHFYPYDLTSDVFEANLYPLISQFEEEKNLSIFAECVLPSSLNKNSLRIISSCIDLLEQYVSTVQQPYLNPFQTKILQNYDVLHNTIFEEKKNPIGLGLVKFNALKLLVALLSTGHDVIAVMLSRNFFDLCLGLMQRYPNHNLLHSLIVQFFKESFICTNNSLLEALINETTILDFLGWNCRLYIDGTKNDSIIQGDTLKALCLKKAMRLKVDRDLLPAELYYIFETLMFKRICTYYGHMSQIVSLLYQQVKSNPELLMVLEKHPQWPYMHTAINNQ